MRDGFRGCAGLLQNSVQYICEHHVKYATISLLQRDCVQQNLWKVIHVLKYPSEIC